MGVLLILILAVAFAMSDSSEGEERLHEGEMDEKMSETAKIVRRKG